VSSQDGVEPGRTESDTTRIVVAVCTYRRNEMLDRLLSAIRRNIDELPPSTAVGVVVVDDNPDGAARSVCDRHRDNFPLGLHYRQSGAGNISVARNLGLDAALPISDWIAMTDDDCEPVDTWLASYVATQRETGASALTGPCFLDPGPDAPKWLREQPFYVDAQLWFVDREQLTVAATNNSFVRSSFLREHPWLRFEPELGITGGEDMVFYRSAHAAGLDIVYSAESKVIGHQPPERATFRYQLRSRFWLGNTEYVTNAHQGNGNRAKWFFVSARRMLLAITRPLGRIVRGRDPQFRYAVAIGARAVGTASGALGLKARHH
jgi:succinoglycan biosynthesis protein ExoM